MRPGVERASPSSDTDLETRSAISVSAISSSWRWSWPALIFSHTAAAAASTLLFSSRLLIWAYVYSIGSCEKGAWAEEVDGLVGCPCSRARVRQA
eukprot:scaffold109774_cov54-Phaeocystis_antarctica.AAC.3